MVMMKIKKKMRNVRMMSVTIMTMVVRMISAMIDDDAGSTG